MESLQVNAIFPAIAAADAAEFKQVAADVLKRRFVRTGHVAVRLVLQR